MSAFLDVTSSPVLLTEGSVIERLRRDPSVGLDTWVENAGLIYSDAGRRSLGSIYRQYLDIGKRHDVPMIVFSPTWRANPERVHKAGLTARDVNGDGVRFLAGIRSEYEEYARRVLIGGLIGCRGDAYRPEESLSINDAESFHRAQLQALAGAGVDFLLAATLPAAPEAIGLAHAMSQCGLPYALSFVIGADGSLLDGMPLHRVIATIDGTTAPGPAFYMVNCVHPLVFRKSYTIEMMTSQMLARRVIGLQANTSPRSPHELDGLPQLESEDPERLADSMVRLHIDFGLRILGGCCGTDDRHLRRMAEKLTVLHRPKA